MMTIQLTPSQTFALAQAFAETIHARVIETHLARVGTLERQPSSQLAEVCAAIRSIPAGFERRCFVASVRHCFQTLRRQHGTNARWQDYVRAVEAHRNQAAA